MPAALRIVRMASAVRPWWPITSPRSLGRTRNSNTVTCDLFAFDRTDLNLVGIIHERFAIACY